MEQTNQQKEYTGPYRHIQELIDFLKANGIDFSHGEDDENKSVWYNWKKDKTCYTDSS